MKLMEAKYTQALDYIFKSNQSSPYKNMEYPGSISINANTKHKYLACNMEYSTILCYFNYCLLKS